MEQLSNTDTGDTGNGQMNGMNTTPVQRPSLISAAVSFLQNPQVAHSTIIQKEKFLRAKGLNDEEIKCAFQRAGVYTHDPSTIINMDITHKTQSLSSQRNDGVLQKIFNIMNSTAIVAGIMWSIYYFYKHFIGPILFGRKKDENKVIKDAIDSLDKSVDNKIDSLKTDLKKIKDEIRSYRKTDNLLHRDMVTFKNDLDAIKGLLLNRKQFSSPIVPTSIPAWQLQSQRANVSTKNDDNEKHDDNTSDERSGGSSETEIVTKHSDSSLEIIP